MTDMFGNILKINDKIVFTKQISTCSGYSGSKGRSALITGVIESFRDHDTRAVVQLPCNPGQTPHKAYLNKENILKFDWPFDVN